MCGAHRCHLPSGGGCPESTRGTLPHRHSSPRATRRWCCEKTARWSPQWVPSTAGLCLHAESKSGQVRRLSSRGPCSAGQTQGPALLWEAPLAPLAVLPTSCQGLSAPQLSEHLPRAASGESKTVCLPPRSQGVQPGSCLGTLLRHCARRRREAGMPEGGPRISI